MGTPEAGPGRQHYFSAAPAAPSRPRTVRLTLPDLQLDLLTDRGVFSGDAVDAGTKLLLATVPAPGGEVAGGVDGGADGGGGAGLDLLDLGCGYGPVAVTMARRVPAATVWAVDVNRRALELTAANATRAGCGDRVRAVAPEAVPAGVRFAAVYSNPPIRIGKQALHGLLSTWLGRLAGGGAAWLVVHKHLGSDSLARWLEAEGFAVRRLVSRMGYRVLEVGRW